VVGDGFVLQGSQDQSAASLTGSVQFVEEVRKTKRSTAPGPSILNTNKLTRPQARRAGVKKTLAAATNDRMPIQTPVQLGSRSHAVFDEIDACDIEHNWYTVLPAVFVFHDAPNVVARFQAFVVPAKKETDEVNACIRVHFR
jgi:hypothetical protein